MSAASANDQVELAATDELLDLFTGYFDADMSDAQMQPVNNSSIDSDVDFNSPVFSDNYVSKPTLNPLARTQGQHTGSFDVTQFVAR